MPLIEFAGTADSLKYLRDFDCPHLVLVVSGPTKGNQLGGAKFGVPIAARTEGNFLLPGKWVERLCNLMTLQGDGRGRLFQHVFVPARLEEFEFDFYRYLREVQNTSTLIDKGIDVDDVYGILRSSRRGMTAHARNMKVSKDDLMAFNRWSKELHSTTGSVRLDMPETYSSLDAIKPTILRVTRKF